MALAQQKLSVPRRKAGRIILNKAQTPPSRNLQLFIHNKDTFKWTRTANWPSYSLALATVAVIAALAEVPRASKIFSVRTYLP
jgi:hypothetical protein